MDKDISIYIGRGIDIFEDKHGCRSRYRKIYKYR